MGDSSLGLGQILLVLVFSFRMKAGEQMADYGARHKAWREKVLRKDHYLCQECLRYGRKTPATVAHHVKHADEYPELQYVVSNGRALCAMCHNKEHPEKGGHNLIF